MLSQQTGRSTNSYSARLLDGTFDSSKGRIWENMKETCQTGGPTWSSCTHARDRVCRRVDHHSGSSTPPDQGVIDCRTGRTRRRPTWKVSLCTQYPHCSESGLSLISRNEKNMSKCKADVDQASTSSISFGLWLVSIAMISVTCLRRQAGRPPRTPLPRR